MKKVFVLFLVLLLVASAAFAITVSDKEETPATVKASLDLSGETTDVGFVKFGFYKGSAPENFSITTTGGVSISDDDAVKLYPKVDTTGGAKLIATNKAGESGNYEFYLFYQILSGTKYTLTLSLDEKMKLNDDPKLDWTVTLSDASKTSVTTVGEENKSKTILTHDPSQENATVTSAAAYNVTVTTEDISSLKQGTYVGTITLTLTTDGTKAGA
ncbi:MAG TPA: hypothetical protein IAB12_00945 [Candidatus Ornithospirochaeta avicola]|uniref:Uncharacterized protein n=1 Tax=Candidatus Ornithospirochaeta avicola TaxID=2840896 RepID=A0A9D1PRH0_9SPIO|nr:hypothetical protein [Candidatus Ornithospirochaeta avicola]